MHDPNDKQSSIPRMSALAWFSYNIALLSPLPVLFLGAFYVSQGASSGGSLTMCKALTYAAPPTAILLGILALVMNRKISRPIRGKNHAIAGIIIGSFAAIFMLIMLPEIYNYESPFKKSTCQSNLKELEIEPGMADSLNWVISSSRRTR